MYFEQNKRFDFQYFIIQRYTFATNKPQNTGHLGFLHLKKAIQFIAFPPRLTLQQNPSTFQKS